MAGEFVLACPLLVVLYGQLVEIVLLLEWL